MKASQVRLSHYYLLLLLLLLLLSEKHLMNLLHSGRCFGQFHPTSWKVLKEPLNPAWVCTQIYSIINMSTSTHSWKKCHQSCQFLKEFRLILPALVGSTNPVNFQRIVCAHLLLQKFWPIPLNPKDAWTIPTQQQKFWPIFFVPTEIWKFNVCLLLHKP